LFMLALSSFKLMLRLIPSPGTLKISFLLSHLVVLFSFSPFLIVFVLGASVSGTQFVKCLLLSIRSIFMDSFSSALKTFSVPPRIRNVLSVTHWLCSPSDGLSFPCFGIFSAFPLARLSRQQSFSAEISRHFSHIHVEHFREHFQQRPRMFRKAFSRHSFSLRQA
jgi:hypothetical protein